MRMAKSLPQMDMLSSFTMVETLPTSLEARLTCSFGRPQLHVESLAQCAALHGRRWFGHALGLPI
jgi:hypothetical protein